MSYNSLKLLIGGEDPVEAGGEGGEGDHEHRADKYSFYLYEFTIRSVTRQF